MLGNYRQAMPDGGHVLVERGGQYRLEPLNALANGDHTYWGIFDGIELDGREFYYNFSRTVYNQTSESYERKTARIAVNSLVHPSAIIRGGVTVEPGAVVQEEAELMEGAIVKTGRGVAARLKYHHLMADIRNTTAALPKKEASKPNQDPFGGSPRNISASRQHLESR